MIATLRAAAAGLPEFLGFPGVAESVVRGLMRDYSNG